MPTPTRPVTYLNWTPSASPSLIQQPTTGQSNTGWVTGQKVPFQYFNYLLWLTDQWVTWLDYITQNAVLPATTVVLVTNGSTTNGSRVVASLVSTTHLQAGMAASGTGIAAGSYVVEVSGSTATLSKPATATATNSLTFGHEYALATTVQGQLDQIDAAASRNRPYDVVVGAGNECDYATLAALVADTTLGPGLRIYLLDSQSLATTVHPTQNFWKFYGGPGVTLTNSGAVTGFTPGGQGIEFHDIRFVGFTTAIAYQAAGTYGRVMNCNFNTCTTEVDVSACVADKVALTLNNFSEI